MQDLKSIVKSIPSNLTTVAALGDFRLYLRCVLFDALDIGHVSNFTEPFTVSQAL